MTAITLSETSCIHSLHKREAYRNSDSFRSFIDRQERFSRRKVATHFAPPVKLQSRSSGKNMTEKAPDGIVAANPLFLSSTVMSSYPLKTIFSQKKSLPACVPDIYDSLARTNFTK